MKNIAIIFLLSTMALSCVPTKKYEEAIARRDKCEEEKEEIKAKHQELETQYLELKKQSESLSSRVNKIEKDSTSLSDKLEDKTIELENLQEKYDQVKEKNRQLLTGNTGETKRILAELQEMQEKLQKKEDELRALERLLNKRKEGLDELKAELKAKEEKLNELQSILDKKDSEVEALKKKLSEALYNFENNGLTIETKNGKVYVSLDESLLFASGSTKVDTKGKQALKKLAQVLEQNKDINVTVEGHTDTDPYKGTGQIKDNWDLSVLRATNILRIILENGKIDPKRLTAAGRGEYMPVDPADTKEAKRKNRRTEIILTPKLDKLFQIIESN